MINLSALEHNRLSTMKPIDYLYAVIDKRHGSDIKRTDFNRIACMIPRNKWTGEVLPVLRRLKSLDLEILTSKVFFIIINISYNYKYG